MPQLSKQKCANVLYLGRLYLFWVFHFTIDHKFDGLFAAAVSVKHTKSQTNFNFNSYKQIHSNTGYKAIQNLFRLFWDDQTFLFRLQMINEKDAKKKLAKFSKLLALNHSDRMQVMRYSTNTNNFWHLLNWRFNQIRTMCFVQRIYSSCCCFEQYERQLVTDSARICLVLSLLHVKHFVVFVFDWKCCYK